MKYEEVKNESNLYFGNDRQADIFINKYALRDDNDELLEKDPNDMHDRLAKEFARIEATKFENPYSFEFIRGLFDRFRYIIPQGSPCYAIGNKHKYVSTANCVHGESLVYTKNRGLVPMKDIVVGDYVLTHKNRFRKVLRHWSNGIKQTVTLSRQFNKNRLNVRSESEMSRFCAVTEDHLVLDQNDQWVESRSLIGKHNRSLKSPCIEYESEPPAGFYIGLGRHIVIDESFMWLCGLYCAEGSIKRSDSDNPSVYFTLNVDELDYVNKIKDFCIGNFGKEPWVQSWGGLNFIQVNIFEGEFAKLLQLLFGVGCHNKRLPHWMFGLNSKLKRSFLDGFMSGDATNYQFLDDSKNFYSLANPTLVYEIGLMFRSINKQSRFNFNVSGKLIRHRTASASINDGQDYINIVKSPVEVEVFDMEVEDDHSFVAGDIICHNCFVADSPLDSYGGILYTDQQLAQISKRRGGIGCDLSHIRPSTISTQNSSRFATGVPTFAERFSRTIREVGQNGRRGALMLTLSIHHPESVILPSDEVWNNPQEIILKGNSEKFERDIHTSTRFYNPDHIDFCTMKLNRQYVTGANISLKLTDEFLEAVKNGEKYEQRLPVDYKERGIKPIISRWVDARKVWQKIIHCAWQSAEPGLLFWDVILRESPADCYADYGFKTVSTNPCGEIPLSVLDSCRLMVLNIVSYIKDPYLNPVFDWKLLYEHAYVAQRLMDDLVDLELEAIQNIIEKIQSDPEPEHVKQNELETWQRIFNMCEKGRRTGLGVTSLGDSVAMMGLKYGSEKSIEFVSKVYEVIKFASYQCSADMAKELGPFPVWDWELEKDSPFLNRFKDSVLTIDGVEGAPTSLINGSDILDKIKHYGRRNIANLTTAPVGTMSQLALLGQINEIYYHETSSGIEPIYDDEKHIRRRKVNPNDPNVRVDFVDESGDKWQNYDVYPSSIRYWMDVTGETDITKSPYYGATATKLDWKNRVKLQGAVQKHIDHSISSTVNLPSDVTEDEVAKIYLEAWKSNCKGLTVYRDGCRSGVLIKNENYINKNNAPKRPKDLPCDIHQVKVKGFPYTVLVGLYESNPYEVMVACGNHPELSKLNNGILRKQKRGHYQLIYNDQIIIDNVTESCNPGEDALTRMTSAALRHGVPLKFLLEQLTKSKDSINSFAKAIARCLKKYVQDEISGTPCPNCGNNLKFTEGCMSCQCGYSKC